MPAKTRAALILSAGFSTRMGKGYKPLLPVPLAGGDRSALACLAGLYAEAGVERILVVGGQRREDALAAEAARLGLAYVQNPDATRGMFSSVLAGLEALGNTGTGCFIHPVDIPLVRLCTLRALLAASGTEPESVLIPTYKGEEGHPPLLPAGCFFAVRAWGGEQGLRGALGTVPCRRVPVADKNILLDMDTDEDYAEVCRRAPRRHLPEPEEARELLRYRAVEEKGVAHAEAVGLVARSFALACKAAGLPLDPDIAETGGLLHDMCKGEPGHEAAAGRTLREMGLPAAALLVEEHRDCRLDDAAPLTEKELVYLADKYVYGSRLVDIHTRFGQKLALYAGDEDACAAIRGRLERAERMERRVARESGKEPVDLAAQALRERRA